MFKSISEMDAPPSEETLKKIAQKTFLSIMKVGTSCYWCYKWIKLDLISQYNNETTILLEYPCKHCGHTFRIVNSSKNICKKFIKLFGPEPYHLKEKDIVEEELE